MLTVCSAQVVDVDNLYVDVDILIDDVDNLCLFLAVPA